MQARIGMAAAVLLFVAGCGGGGGGGGGGGSDDPGPVTPTGDFTAFLADGQESGRVEFYVADAEGLDVRVVSGGLGLLDGDVLEYQWSPNRSRIAFTQDTDADGHAELWCVNPAIGNPWLLRDPGTLLGASIVDFLWSPTSQHVAFREHSSLLQPARLWIVPTIGGTSVNVSGTIVSAGNVSEGYAFRPMSTTRIAFRGDLVQDEEFALFTNTLDGSDRVKVNDFGFNPDPQVEPGFAWAPNGSRIAFLADMLVAGQIDLYTNDPDGGDQALESESLGALHDVTMFKWAPTGMTLAYVHDAAFNEIHDLHTVVSPNGAMANLTNFPDLSAYDVIELAWAPDATRIAMIFDEGTELRTTLATGGGTTLIATQVKQWSWSPDASHLAYVQGPQLAIPYDTLHSVNADGTDYETISDTEITDTTIFRFHWAPDSSRLLFVTDSGNGLTDLRVVDREGNEALTLYGATSVFDSVAFEAFAPNSDAVCYLANSFVANDVYAVLVDGTQLTNLCADLANANADAFAVALK